MYSAIPQALQKLLKQARKGLMKSDFCFCDMLLEWKPTYGQIGIFQSKIPPSIFEELRPLMYFRRHLH